MIVYTGGTFDLLHSNHIHLLEYARVLAGKDGLVIVGVNTDEELATRGKNPIVPFQERLLLVRSIKYVDMAVPQYNQDYESICSNLNVDIILVGDDWKGKFDNLKSRGIQVFYTPRGEGVSTTRRKQEVFNKLLAQRAELD